MFRYLKITKKWSKNWKISKNLTILRKNRHNIFFFLALTYFLMLDLLTNSASPIPKENSLKIEELALINNNTLLPLANPNNPETKVVKKMNVIVTAYSSTPWETWGDPSITASGVKVKDGIIANNYFSFGTKIKIPELYGDKVFVVQDRMNSKKNYNQIDIWFPSYQQAKEFGTKKTYIEILEN